MSLARSVRQSSRPTISSRKVGSAAGKTLRFSESSSIFGQPRHKVLSSFNHNESTATMFVSRQFTSTRIQFQETEQSKKEEEANHVAEESKNEEKTETEENNKEENEMSSEEMKKKISQLEKEKAELEEKYKEAREGHSRAVADAENTRRISERNMADAKKYALQGFAKDLLEVSDNLERALGSVSEEERNENKPLRTLYEGVTMTDQIFHNVLQKHGINKFESMGKPFDPNMHEALFETKDENQEHGVVSHVMQEGFTLNDRVIRPARTGVNKRED